MKAIDDKWLDRILYALVIVLFLAVVPKCHVSIRVTSTPQESREGNGL